MATVPIGADVTAAPRIRSRLDALMEGTVRNEPNWHYAFVRPLPLPTLAQALHGTVQADCSFGCKILCHLAGAPDPTGRGYDNGGNSVDMYNHLPHIPFKDVLPGDCAVFGHTDGEQHAVMVRRKARTIGSTLVWSHGQEAGPILVPLTVEINAHPGAKLTFLRTVPVTSPPNPTPAPVPTVEITGPAGKPIAHRPLPAALKLIPALLRRFPRVSLRKVK